MHIRAIIDIIQFAFTWAYSSYNKNVILYFVAIVANPSIDGVTDTIVGIANIVYSRVLVINIIRTN